MNLDDKTKIEIDTAISHLEFINHLPIEKKVIALNEIRSALHNLSPFVTEPVDYVKWVLNTDVDANDYNPNSVAPPEMELLRLSIMADGYTQPIVSNKENDRLVVIDGFHRNRVGKECVDVQQRVHGYLPIVQIRTSQAEKADRMASTLCFPLALLWRTVEAILSAFSA